MRNYIYYILVAGLLISCRSEKPQTGSTLIRLETGKEVRIYSITRITRLENKPPQFFMLRYETSLEPKDSKALREEVLEVWKILEPKCDSAGDRYAIIKANEPIRGTVAITRSFSYGIEKNENGDWRIREPSN